MELLQELLGSINSALLWVTSNSEHFYQVILALLGVILAGVLVLWRRSLAKRNYNRGHFPEEMKVVCNIFDPVKEYEEWHVDGTGITQKPRTSESAQPLLRAFPNPVLAEKIVAATKKCDPTIPGKSFVVLDTPEDRRRLATLVRDIVSSQTPEGQMARMHGLPVIKKIGFACVTFAPDGDQRKIRLDVISQNDLERFMDPDFIEKLTNRPDEGSHDDLISIFSFAAQRVWGPVGNRSDYHAIRVSNSFFAPGMSPEQIAKLSDE